GYHAGYNQKSDGNVFIGYRAGYSETDPNRLIIANSANSPPLIYGNFDTGRVGIGTTSLSRKLEVSGTIKAEGTDAGVWAIASDYDGAAFYGQATSSVGQHFGGYFTASGTYGIGAKGLASGTEGRGVEGFGGTNGYDFYAAGPSNVDYGTASSIRWKKDVRLIDNPLDKVQRLRGVYFN
ncbi:MAG: tail fiber domain-containing protein, partial [Planctomycetes bacterium]|nr:tail fiber domain-containing protein [Planctomycetota bacterium]